MILINIKQMPVYTLVGVKILGQGLHVPTKATEIGPQRTMMIPQYLLQLSSVNINELC